MKTGRGTRDAGRARPLRGAILGMGNVAINGHLPGWIAREDVEIVATADVSDVGRAALAQRLPAARWYDSVEKLFERETLDFVDISTPPAFHEAVIRQVLEHDFHVLCEKPLVLSSSALEPLAKLAREKRRVLATVHNWRHAPALRRLTELVNSGVVGTIRRVRWETLRDRPAAVAGPAENWRVDPSIAGGGILLDHGWHALYAIQQWIPGDPAVVSARLEGSGHGRVGLEETAEITLDYPDARSEIFLTWAAEKRANRVILEGSEGAIALDGRSLEIRDSSGRIDRREEVPGSLSEGSHHPDWFACVIEEFLGEIRNPDRRGRSLAEAKRCLEWIEKAYESGRRRQDAAVAEAGR